MNTVRIRPALSLRLAVTPRWAAAAAAAAAALAPMTAAPASPAAACQQTLIDGRRWSHQHRKAHPHASEVQVPAPIPLVPDVATFLSIVGRNMKQHTAKFPTWEALFTLTSPQLRELGIEPPRDRRYLLRWLQRYREGRFGIGGDFAFVRDGVAELRVQQSADEADPLKVRKTVVNVPAPPPAAPAEAEAAAEGEGEGAEETEAEAETAKAAAAAPPTADDVQGEPVPVHGYKVVGARAIAGPYALPLAAGTGSRVTVTEGMWEDKRGRKIDGGERRRAEVRFKRRAAERRAQREQLGLY